MSSETPARLRVALDPALAPYAPEVKYVLRTLLTSAGYAFELMWSSELPPGEDVHIYYGRESNAPRSALHIHAFPQGFARWSTLDPLRVIDQDGIPFLCFDDCSQQPIRRTDSRTEIDNDIVFASFWLLVGASEGTVSRDRWDNLHVQYSFIVKSGLVRRPAVSLYAAFLREYFEQRGLRALRPTWSSGERKAAFSFTHDVDYPQMIRWIESLRLLRSRGVRAFNSIAGIWSGSNHFWKFADWVEFERTFGARPAFYFMARQGSLLQYARGTPDAFYNIRSRAFQELFPYLRQNGSEIGLHASYHAHKSTTQLQHEKNVLEQAAGVTVRGGRHHYWHLDPEAPHSTLLKHEHIGMQYDSSLGFEFYPGWRRGSCHPFGVFHTGERRELDLVQVPPTWMDDHFDRRRAINHIDQPEQTARELMDTARGVGGVIVVDYHARGMNEDFYPQYGRWLRSFAKDNFDSTLQHVTPAEVAAEYNSLRRTLQANSRDAAVDRERVLVQSAADTPAVAIQGD
jgi:hypothetical protein